MIDNTSYSTVGFRDRSLEAALDGIAAAGFPQVEIQGKEPHVAVPPTGRALSDFRAQVEGRGLRARTVHAPSGRTVLGAPEEAWREENMGALEGSIVFAAAIGATDIVIHPIPNPIFVPDADDPSVPGRVRDAVGRSLDHLIPVAEAAGIRINLENLPYHCDYPFRTMQELRPLVDTYPEAQLGLVIDIGHAGVLRLDPSAEIHAAGPRLQGTHLHDVDFDVPKGDHRAPTHGGLDWDAIRRALTDVRYAGPWTFEVFVADHGESPEDLAHITRRVATAWGLCT